MHAPKTSIAEATKLIQANRLDDAKSICDALVTIDREDADALYALGWIALCHDDVGTAESHFRRVLDLRPEHARAHYNLGTILMRRGKLSDAAERFEAAAAADPNSSDALCNLGTIRIIGRKFDEAIKNFHAAIAINPKQAEAHYGLATALASSTRVLEAVEHYQKAIAVRPDFAEAHNGLGVCLDDLDRLDEAEACYAKALEYKGGFAQAHSNLALSLRRSGKLKRSIDSARAALEYDPQSVEAYFNLGKALELDGQHEAALATYRKALGVKTDGAQPSNGAGHANIGEALEVLGRFDEAIKHLEAAGDENSKARILGCYFALGRAEEFDKGLHEICRSDRPNLRAAGISAFAAHQWRREDHYPFCKGPLDFVDIKNVGSQIDSFEAFSEDLLKETEQIRSVRGPRRGTTVNEGYRTVGNLFHVESPRIAALQDLILRQIEEYRSEYAGRTDSLIAQWPRHASLAGWHTKVAKGGHQTPHNHPGGWLSGVFYLKIPQFTDPDEGSITFTLRVPHLPVIDEDIPTLHHSPNAGDLVLFPSSLFHYTNPFSTDGERHVVAFDLCPAEGQGR